MNYTFYCEYNVMTLFNNKYRVESIRLKNWDYASDGYYFITICTKNRKHHFGKIDNGKMILSPIGKLVEKFWQEIPEHFHFIKLDLFIIMPDHIHGILIIDNQKHIKRNSDEEDKTQMQKIAPKKGELSTVIRSYKSIVTRESRKIDQNFNWLSGYWDVIIRNEISLFNIRKYIEDNPKKWRQDKK